MKKVLWLFCLMLFFPVMMSCGKKEQVDKSRIYDIYVINKGETKISANEYNAENTDQDALIDELLAQLMAVPEKLEYNAPLAGHFALLGYSMEGGQLILNFLTRAAVVRTMTQIEGVDYVSFQIRSNPLTDAADNVIGIMSADMFIDNTESEINAREKVRIRLYFANEAGDKLIETNRTLVYSTNIAMEKLVVEQLIGGPSEQVKDKVYPTINPETKIIGVTVKDGTCYVNLNENFLTQIYNVTSDVTIYSIANSLVELPNVNRVQIAINGDSNVMFRENTSLTVTFERNLDMVTTIE